jgi:FkbM family methyltransferase
MFSFDFFMDRVTNELRTDGFGAQFQSVLWTLLWAELTGRCFQYTDIPHIDLISNSGTVKDHEDENTLDEVVRFMAFKDHYPPADGARPVFNMTAYAYVEANIDAVFASEAFQRFKTRFFEGKTRRVDGRVHVAVHIRRLNNFERENGRFRPGSHDTPNAEYLAIIRRIRAEYAGRDLVFDIYSQGHADDFKEFESDQTVLHLNEKVLDSFTDLVFADVLVTCRSSFSYLAALLSDGDVYYMPFWHPPLSKWRRTDTFELRHVIQTAGIPLENGKLVIPPQFTRIKLDIGIAIEAIHTEDWLNKHPTDLLVFGFEPLPLCVQKTREYFQQTTSKWGRNQVIDKGWLDHAFRIVPVALGKSTGVADFYVTSARNVGCSSLLRPTDDGYRHMNVTLDRTIPVPVFRLAEFFALLPDTVAYVEHIKVDTQGTDLEVIQSGGHYIADKVVYVTMEPESSTYHGAEGNTVERMTAYMNSIGFDLVDARTNDPTFLNRKFQHVASSIYISQFN